MNAIYIRRLIAKFLIVSQIFMGSVNSFAQVASVTPVGGNTNVIVPRTGNGVPIVNINAANSAGVSVNRYTQFNVGSNGLVLNNSVAANGIISTSSQLAGSVLVNPNLAAPARLIMNEVTTNNPSNLNGYIEVAGQKADVVVANPWGITCNGCGFINTARATLTTGVPIYNSNGSLGGFNVQQGAVNISGQGLDATQTDILDLLARSVQVNGAVYARNLSIYTGLNQFNYANRSVTGSTNVGTDSTPLFAIDASLLGAMQAGKITLIATESGVGVRMLGNVAATADDFNLTASGQIVLQNKLSAQGKINITNTQNGSSINLENAQLSAQGDLNVNADGGVVDLTAGLLWTNGNINIAASRFTDTGASSTEADANKRYASGDITIAASNTATMGGVTYGTGAGGRLNVSASDISLDSAAATTLSADNGVSLSASNGLAIGVADIVSNGAIQIGGGNSLVVGASNIVSEAANVTLSSNGTLSNSGMVQASAGSLSVKAANSIQNTGTLQGAGSVLLSDLSGSTGVSVSNSGTIASGNSLSIHGSNLTNSGKIQGGTGNSEITLTGALNNNSTGVLTLGTDSNASGAVKAKSLTNAGTLYSYGNMSLGNNTNKLDTITNSGQLGSAETLTLDAVQDITNTGTIASGNSLSIHGSNLTNSGTIQGGTGNSEITLTGALNNNSAGVLTLGTDSSASGAVKAKSLTNAGTLYSYGNMSLGNNTNKLDTITNSGQVGSAETLTLDAVQTDITNTGVLASGANMTINTTRLNLAGASSSIVGALHGGTTTIHVTDSGGFSNPGSVYSGGSLDITSSSITNTSTGGLVAADVLTLTASNGNMQNSGALYGGTAVNVSATNQILNVGGLSSAEGAIDSGGNISLTAPTVTNNSTINADGNITITATTFHNDVFGGDTRYWTGSDTAPPAGTTATKTGSSSSWCGADKCDRDYYEVTWTNSQAYRGGTPTFHPEINAGSTLTITNFNTGTNTGGRLSGDTVVLTGSGSSATFVNTDLSLQTKTYKRTYDLLTHYIAQGPAVYDRNLLENDVVSLTGTSTTSQFGATISANTLSASGFSLTNSGSPATPSVDSLPSANPRARSTPSVAGSGSSNLVTLGSSSITLPVNPNGYFIPSTNPTSKYLIETNPKFLAAGATVDDSLLESLYGFSPDRALKLLGDAAYTNYVVLQQVRELANGGTLGYSNQNQLLRSLAMNSSSEAVSLKLVVGQAPTEAQLASLQRDIVWFVIKKVNGQEVLVPQLFLSQTTKDSINHGAVIQANNLMTMDINSLTNVGGTIVVGRSYQPESSGIAGAIASTDNMAVSSGAATTNRVVAPSHNLIIKTHGDINNISGTIAGGNVQLESVNGNINNKTAVFGDPTLSSVLGKTATIKSTGDLRINAAKNFENTGANVKASGNVNIFAGGDVTFKTVAQASTSVAHSSSDTFGAHSSTTVKTTIVNQVGSNLLVGGNAKITSGGQFVLRGSNAAIAGGLDMNAKGGVNILAAENKRTTETTTHSSGLGVGGGGGIRKCQD